MYQDCPKKYFLAYEKNIRSTELPSNLLFGSAIDKGLNELLISKDLNKANDVFIKEFSTKHDSNGKPIDLKTSELVQYLASDFQEGILSDQDAADTHKYNPNWVSLRRKGILMLQSYNDYVLPKIEEVISIQERTETKLKCGVILEGTLDIIARINGKVYLLDNKTSSSDYEEDAAQLSQQLSIYYYQNKHKYNLDGVGFIVLKKNIWERKTKICSLCKFDGSGTNFRTCSNLVQNKRCNGEWDIVVNAKCFIDVILNDTNQLTLELAMEGVNGVAEGIKKKIFPPNFQSCRVKRGNQLYLCQYYGLCHKGSMEGLIEEKKK